MSLEKLMEKGEEENDIRMSRIEGWNCGCLAGTIHTEYMHFLLSILILKIRRNASLPKVILLYNTGEVSF